MFILEPVEMWVDGITARGYDILYTMKLTDHARIAGTLSIATLKNGKVLREIGPFPNKFVSSTGYGRNLVLRAMAGDATYPIAIDSASVGTGNTAAADSDTNLVTPVATGLTITSLVTINDQLTVEVFVPDASLANGTYKEFGLFATARLISRILITPNYTKATGEDTLFTYTLTLTG